MEENNINDILGIDDSNRQSNNESTSSNRAYIPVSKNENVSFANVLNIVGVILYFIGVVAAIYLLDKLSDFWISGFVLFYHIVLGLICQGISKVIENMRK